MLRIPPKDRQGLVIVVYQVITDRDWCSCTWDEAELATMWGKN